MAIEIREANATDLECGLLETLGCLAEVRLTLDEAREVFRSRLRVGTRTFVALDDGRVIGTVSLLIERKFIHHGGTVAHIEDVAVHNTFQKRGIASALVEYTIQEARRSGCYKVILGCYEQLTPFYERLGFRRHDLGMRLDLDSSIHYRKTGTGG